MTDTTQTLSPKPWISGIAPYVPGKSAGADGRPLIKLSANENPLGTGEKARAAFAAAQAAPDALSRYPDPGSIELRAAIAAKFGELLARPDVEDVVAAQLLPDAESQERLPLVLERIEAMARLG